MTEYSAPTFDVNIDPTGWVMDLNSLYEHLTRLHDSRHARGTRYALVTVLVYVVLRVGALAAARASTSVAPTTSASKGYGPADMSSVVSPVVARWWCRRPASSRYP